MAVSTRTRFEIFKRDKFTCQYCGRTPPAVVLHCDHIHPTSKGGDDEASNLLTSCMDCNLGKSNVELNEPRIPKVTPPEEIVERREQLEAYNALLMEQREHEDWLIDRVGAAWFGEDLTFADNIPWRISARNFVRKLPLAEILESVEISHARWSAPNSERQFRYFCGVCWNKIKQSEGGRL